MKPEISNYMREMQRLSAASRWGGLSVEEELNEAMTAACAAIGGQA